MNTTLVRRAHRRLAVGFLAAVVITVVGPALNGPEWVVQSPLVRARRGAFGG